MSTRSPLAIFNEPDLDLLLMTRPLIELANGDKRARARRAWLNAAHRLAGAAAGISGDHAPPTARGLALSLLRLSIMLADITGMPRDEIVTAYHDYARSGLTGSTSEIDEFLTGSLAALLHLAAVRQIAVGEARGETDLVKEVQTP
jgi:hypothetical protein